MFTARRGLIQQRRQRDGYKATASTCRVEDFDSVARPRMRDVLAREETHPVRGYARASRLMTAGDRAQEPHVLRLRP